MMLVPIMLLTIDAECPANKQEARAMDRAIQFSVRA
jgi:hypothetical protein